MLLISPTLVYAQTDYVTRIGDDERIALAPDMISLIFDSTAQLPKSSTATEPLHEQPVQLNLSDDSLDHEIRIATNTPAPVSKSPEIEKLSPEQLRRQAQIARCLSMYFRMPIETDRWRPWTIMHGLLPFGQQSRVKSNGQLYYAADYLCHNAIGNDTHMLYLSGNSLGVSVGPGVQGHEGQFLAMLAQADVPITKQIHVGGRTFTIADLVEYEKRGCRRNTELTFKLIGLSHYLDSEEIWKSDIGKSWNIERLIHEELKQPINGAACGGTHRLMGLSYAINQRTGAGEKLVGEWARAQRFIGEYQDYALQFQNSDGSFSTNWFVTQEAETDLKKRLYTTGHIVEWLTLSLPDERINDPKMTKAVDYLTNLMLTAPSLDLEIGPKGHAIHALRMYEKRAFGISSDLEEINPSDLAQVEKALIQQKNMQPEFSTVGTPAQNVSFPGTGAQGRRIFRRR